MLAFLILALGVVVVSGALGALAPRLEKRSEQQTQVIALIAAAGAIFVGIGFDRLLGQSLETAGVGVAPLIRYLVTHPVPISMFLGAITAYLLVLFIRDSWQETPNIETHWGGFGGGLGGWRVSRSIVYLAAAVLFAILLVVASYPVRSDSKDPASKTKTGQTADK